MLFLPIRDQLYDASAISVRPKRLDEDRQDLMMTGGSQDVTTIQSSLFCRPSPTVLPGPFCLPKMAAQITAWVETASSVTQGFLTERIKAQRMVDDESAASTLACDT
jgi:hypothetical protein